MRLAGQENFCEEFRTFTYSGHDRIDDTRILGAVHTIASSDEVALLAAQWSQDFIIDTIPTKHDVTADIEVVIHSFKTT